MYMHCELTLIWFSLKPDSSAANNIILSNFLPTPLMPFSNHDFKTVF